MTREERTKAEHEAGAEALFRVRVLKGLDDQNLKKRFKQIVSTNIGKDTEGEWQVEVKVRANDRKIYGVVGPLLGYPNDELIAQLMLLDPNA